MVGGGGWWLRWWLLAVRPAVGFSLNLDPSAFGEWPAADRRRQ